LLNGDIIIQLDNQDISSSSSLFRKLNAEKIGKKSILTVIRRTTKKDIEIIPEEKTTAK
jgi:S1-C subfamily serine protease